MTFPPIPWTPEYHQFREQELNRVTSDNDLLESFRANRLPENYGKGIDERVVEFPWLLSNLTEGNVILDAGSTLNQSYIVNHPMMAGKNLSIYTYYPEGPNFYQKRISYVYGDLRSLPFKDGWFDQIACISTLEHIDMDNSIYGYEIPNNSSSSQKSYEYLNVVKELCRVLAPKGQLLISVPFGVFEKHGFFQQFDGEMSDRVDDVLRELGLSQRKTFFRYTPQGWVFSNQQECSLSKSFNPHTGVGKGDDGAAHSRAILCWTIQK